MIVERAAGGTTTAPYNSDLASRYSAMKIKSVQATCFVFRRPKEQQVVAGARPSFGRPGPGVTIEDL